MYLYQDKHSQYFNKNGKKGFQTYLCHFNVIVGQLCKTGTDGQDLG